MNGPALEGPPADRASAEDMRTVAALLAGDEAAFEALVRRHHESMVRLAVTFVRSRAIAEEVAQDAWAGVLRSLHRFEGRSSLRTWIFRILTNQARTRGVRERRTVPFSALGAADEPAVAADRFLPADHPAYPGDWAAPPRRWDDVPEARLLGGETCRQLMAAMDDLPPAQRAVIVLRDVHGFAADEVCDLLDLSEGNQRVLLHRARAKVRGALEAYLDREVA